MKIGSALMKMAQWEARVLPGPSPEEFQRMLAKVQANEHPGDWDKMMNELKGNPGVNPDSAGNIMFGYPPELLGEPSRRVAGYPQGAMSKAMDYIGQNKLPLALAAGGGLAAGGIGALLASRHKKKKK